ncbi:(d)CMP kinase [Anaerospora sp.]|uniref:(d)CMP kinase n=1 Tax=Anaerospora sp. TaxID=1960278 RepID=UPI0028968F15|nr:(d)CMP kinase [Anaerospora sp.]
MKKLIIAIDGPAGAGKSTVAQIVAQRLGYTYIDTGAMYRAVTWQVMQHDVDFGDADAIQKIVSTIQIGLRYVNGKMQVTANQVDITEEIRLPEVSRVVSEVAKLVVVRTAMLTLQRQMAQSGGVVMDGRDIGTHVLPNADLKIFLTASIDERARRRWRELGDKGVLVDLNALQEEIASRDKTDSERAVAPLVQAEDAILLDTTKLSIEGAVNEILRLCEERGRSV